MWTKVGFGSITTNKASGGDGIPVELFQILKDDAMKELHSICQHLEIAAVATGLEKVSFIPIPKKGNAKDCSNYQTIPIISHASNVQHSPSQASTVHEPWTSRCWSWIEKRQRSQRSNCQHLLDHLKSKRVPEKHLFLLYWLRQSLWLHGSQ